MTQTRKEMLEQPEVVARVAESNWPLARHRAAAINKAGPSFALIAARGTSDNAAVYANYLWGARNGLPVALATPSLHTYYGRPPRLNNAVVVGISQSGASTDIVEVLSDARAQGALTLAITNTEDSALAEAADLVLPCLAGEEKAVAATKTYTAELANVALLSVALSGSAASLAELQAVPDAMRAALALEGQVAAAVERYRYMDARVLFSRGYNFATALEVALKTQELAYVLTHAYSSADFMHGPLAGVHEGFPVLGIVTSGALCADLVASLRIVRDRGAEIMIMSDRDEALSLGRRGLRIPSVPEWLSPMVAVIPGQWFAICLAQTKGYDPDKPRALHKVTLTR